MIMLLLLLTLAIGSNLSADSYQVQANTPVQPPTGYVMVPVDELSKKFAPQTPQVSLKDLTSKALATKNSALTARADVSNTLTNYEKASQSLTDAQALHKEIQDLIAARQKVKDEQTAKLKDSITKAQAVSNDAKDSAKKVRNGKSTATNASEASDADRAASTTEDIATSVDSTVNQAIAKASKDDPSFQTLQK